MRSTMSFRSSILVSTALLLPSTALATPTINGKVFNTEALNGKVFNGKVFNSQMLEAVSTSSAWKDGAAIGGTAVDGSGLAGWGIDWSEGDAATWEWRTGEWYVGTDLLGQFVNAIDGYSETLRLHIDAIQAAEDGSDTLLHWVTVHSTSTQQSPNGWMPETSAPLCTDTDGNAVPAIVLRGEWSSAEGVSWGGDQISDSPYEITFACTNGALGKCAADCDDAGTCAAFGVPVALGYRRWAAPTWWAVEEDDGAIAYHWRDYAMEHQSCTRMIRADYCGNGKSWTETGTQIDVYDRMHDNWWDEVGSVPPAWFFDATWNEDGAVAVSCGRVSGDAITCEGLTTIGGPLMMAVSVFDRVIPAPIVSHPLACLGTDGLEDPDVRLGNLRHALPGE